MRNEFDDGREYPTGLLWRKARSFYAHVSLRVRYTAEEILRNGVDSSWADLVLVKARLRAEINDLQAEIRARKKMLAALDKVTMQKVGKTRNEALNGNDKHEE